LDISSAGHSSPPPQRGFVPTPLANFFGEADQAFRMRFTRGEPAEFFGPTSGNNLLLTERRSWLRSAPQTYAALLPDGEPLLEHAVHLAREWHGFDNAAALSPLATCLALGEFWEPDFLLMGPNRADETVLLGGCLCFASSWELSAKVGRPIDFIHAPVPGLNAALGPAIRKFLAGLKPGLAWRRMNWGMSRSPELNQHPARPLPRLDASVTADQVWLRIEEQALVALDRGVLFGIRVINHSLAEISKDPLVAAGVCCALESMPEDLARYKHLSTARQRICALLQGSE
jgi:Haem-dependent oxidative N-demethylase, alpha subunit-like